MIELNQIQPILVESHIIGDNITSQFPSISNKTIYIIQDLFDNECCNTILKNSIQCAISEIQEGDNVQIEVNIYRITKYGYYVYLKDYIKKCRDKTTTILPAYIQEISAYADLQNNTVKKIDFAIRLTKEVSKCYPNSSSEYILLPYEYSILKISTQFTKDDIEQMPNIKMEHEHVLGIIADTHNILSKIYQTEICDFFTQTQTTEQNIGHLLKSIDNYIHKCNCCIELYVKQFSFKDIKIQIDKSVLDYSDKLQTVIVNAQTRLIAIPAAFILAVASLDLSTTWSVINIAVIIGIIFFIILIDIFIKNQADALYTIEKSIDEYKNNFHPNPQNESINKEITNKFSTIKQQLQKQKSRLKNIRIIIYFVPLPILFFILKFEYIKIIFINISNFLSWIIAGFATMFYTLYKILTTII